MTADFIVMVQALYSHGAAEGPKVCIERTAVQWTSKSASARLQSDVNSGWMVPSIFRVPLNGNDAVTQ